jgi:glycosyltransferase involved in cell wall biosynthesis
VRLLHVGGVVDAPLPHGERFEHDEAVDQRRLVEFYARGHVFALASRQEGLALVQALACGLPLVCTDRTGGEDLKEFLEDPSLVTVVPPDDPLALAEALRQVLDRARRSKGLRDLLGPAREKLSWREYGRRYDAELRGRTR